MRINRFEYLLVGFKSESILVEFCIQNKVAQFDWRPPIRRLEAEAGGVHDRHNCEICWGVWQINAANAPTVGQLDAQRVLDGAEFALCSRLHTLDHESVFRREINSVPLFLLLIWDGFLDAFQIELHRRLKCFFPCFWTLHRLPNKLFDLVIGLVTAFGLYVDDLLEVKLNFCNI